MTTKEEHFVGHITGDTDVFYLVAFKNKHEYISRNAGNNLFPGPTAGMYSTEKASLAKVFADKAKALKEIKSIKKNRYHPVQNMELEVVSASVLVAHKE